MSSREACFLVHTTACALPTDTLPQLLRETLCLGLFGGGHMPCMDASDNWEILAKEGSSEPLFAHLQRVSNRGASTRGCGNKAKECLLGRTPYTKPQPLLSHCLPQKHLMEAPLKGLSIPGSGKVSQLSQLISRK